MAEGGGKVFSLNNPFLTEHFHVLNNFIAQRRSGYVKQMQTTATEANGPERYEALDYGKGSA